MEAPVQTAYIKPEKKSAVNIILIVAVIVLFCMVIASLVANVLLYLNGSSLKKDITDLQGKSADASAKIQTVTSNVSQLQSGAADLGKQISTLSSGDIAAMKGDITKLQDLTKLPNPTLTISDLDVKHYTDTYFEYYDGEATISCSDLNSEYLVVIKQTLNSGGETNKTKILYEDVIVVNGTAKYYTYDYDLKNKIQKPSYTLEIIGFIKVDSKK